MLRGIPAGSFDMESEIGPAIYNFLGYGESLSNYTEGGPSVTKARFVEKFEKGLQNMQK